MFNQSTKPKKKKKEGKKLKIDVVKREICGKSSWLLFCIGKRADLHGKGFTVICPFLNGPDIGIFACKFFYYFNFNPNLVRIVYKINVKDKMKILHFIPLNKKILNQFFI